jgi:lysophospholipase L1-like esterase
MGLKTVVLVGDSIRLGYQETVKAHLVGFGGVAAPTENGGDSGKVLAHLDRWVIDWKPDVVHLNCGLHDVKDDPSQPGLQVPLEEYRENLEAIFRRLRDETAATLIWATTTPVIEARHQRAKPFARRNADIDRCNAAAREAAGAIGGIAINDLNAFLRDEPLEELMMEDGVHFTAEGYRRLGQRVAKVIQETV